MPRPMPRLPPVIMATGWLIRVIGCLSGWRALAGEVVAATDLASAGRCRGGALRGLADASGVVGGTALESAYRQA